MLHEYRDIITVMKVENAHFAKIFDRHNDLDQEIMNAENGHITLTEYEIDVKKKEKLKLKDEAYAMVIEYKKAKRL